MDRKEQLAWAAGLFEGEGTITLNGEVCSPRLKLSMVDFDVVERFSKIVQRGNICYWADHNKIYQKQMCWYTGRKADVVFVLDLLMPYFWKTPQQARQNCSG